MTTLGHWLFGSVTYFQHKYYCCGVELFNLDAGYTLDIQSQTQVGTRFEPTAWRFAAQYYNHCVIGVPKTFSANEKDVWLMWKSVYYNKNNNDIFSCQSTQLSNSYRSQKSSESWNLTYLLQGSSQDHVIK